MENQVTPESTANLNIPTTNEALKNRIIIKPCAPTSFRPDFTACSPLPSFRAINKQVAKDGKRNAKISRATRSFKTNSQPATSTQESNTNDEIITLDDDSELPTTSNNVLQSTPLTQSTRQPIVAQHNSKSGEEDSCARLYSFNAVQQMRTKKKAKKGRFEQINTSDLGLNLSLNNIDPKMAITSEPLLLYYQDLVGNYKKQVRELQTEIKNCRRREEKLKTQSKSPTLAPICKKTYSESSAKLKRQISQRLKESFDILLENCTPEDKKVVLIKAFPDAFVENKLTTEQTWYFEQKFKFNNGNMDKLRNFLNKFNLDPFASRRQINVYKEKLARENPDMLNVQIEDSDSEIRDEEEMQESAYIPNVSVVTRNNQPPLSSSSTAANLQDEIYTSNASSVSAHYGQQLIQQQEQYLRRANSQTYRQNNQNPQQPFGPSAFLPTTSSYTSFYSGHY